MKDNFSIKKVIEKNLLETANFLLKDNNNYSLISTVNLLEIVTKNHDNEIFYKSLICLQISQKLTKNSDLIAEELVSKLNNKFFLSLI